MLMNRTDPRSPGPVATVRGRESSAELFSPLAHCAGGMAAFAYVRGDPVNRRDPSGTQDICAGPRCDPDGTAVVTGPGNGWTLADIDASGLLRANPDLNTGCSFIYHPTVRDRDCDRLINWEPVRLFDLPLTPPAPSPPPPPADPNPDPRRDACGNPLPPASRNYSIPPGYSSIDAQNRTLIDAQGQRVQNPYYQTEWNRRGEVDRIGVLEDLVWIGASAGGSMVQSSIMRILWGEVVGGAMMAGHRLVSSGGEAGWRLGSRCSR